MMRKSYCVLEARYHTVFVFYDCEYYYEPAENAPSTTPPNTTRPQFRVGVGRVKVSILKADVQNPCCLEGPANSLMEFQIKSTILKER